MNITPKKLTLKNFLSFGNKESVFMFPDGEIANIKGINKDSGNGSSSGSSNGSGKTTIMQAVVYALYGRGIDSDMKQDEFINITNEKNMKVLFEFNADDKPVVITRTRKPNAVTLTVDGVDCTRDSIANTNALIQEMIRINFDTFVLSFLMTTSIEPLLFRKKAEQRNFMEDLLGINKLTDRANQIKEIRSELDIDLKLLTRDLENAESSNAKELRRAEAEQERYDNFKAKLKEEIEELESLIPSANDVISKSEDIQKAFDEINIESKSLQGLQEQHNALTSRVASLENDKLRHESRISSLRQDFVQWEGSLQEKEEELSELRSNLVEMSDNLHQKCKPDRDTAVEYLEDLAIYEEGKEELYTKLDSLKAAVKSHESTIETLSTELSHLEEGTCPYCTQQWSNSDTKKKIDNLKTQVSDLEEKKSSDYENIVNTNKALNDLKFDDRGISSVKAANMMITTYDNLVASIKADGEKASILEQVIFKLKSKIDSFDSTEIEKLEKVVSETPSEIDSIAKNIVDLEDQIRIKKANIRDLNETVDYSDYNDFVETRTEAKAILKDYEDAKKKKNPYSILKPELTDVDEVSGKISDIEKELAHCKYLIKLLTDSKSFIRRNIVGKYVPYLNKMINTYATQLDSPHICEIQNDLSVEIEYMRRSVSYHSLSAGEKLKLNISISVALRDLMSMLGVKGNFLMIDEVFDSALDKQSKSNVFKMIRDKFDSVMLVSHSGEFDEKCDKIVKVVKENGFSQLS